MSNGRRTSKAATVIAVIVAVNVAGGAVYLLTRNKNRQQQQQGQSGSSDTPAGEPSAEVSRALRAAGLAALENARYEEAVKRFTDAAKSSRASPDLTELIKIATELRDSNAVAANTVTTTTTTPTEAPKPVAVEPPAVANNDKDDDRAAAAAKADEKLSAAAAAAKRRDAQKEREREAKEAKERDRQRRLTAANARTTSKTEPETGEPAAPSVLPGTVVVSSTPSGLAVILDGRQVDQTPVRLTVEPGPHELTLLYNQTSVFSRRLTVTSSSVQSIDPDLSTQVALLSTPKVVEQPPAPTPPATPIPPVATTKTADEKPASQNLDPNTLYVVANPSLGLSSISASQLADLYFGRSTTINGKRAEPILRSPSAAAGAAFFSRVLQSNTRQFRESWQKLELSSGAKAPPILANTGDVLRAVSGRSGALSFALGSEINGGATTLKALRITN